MPENAKRRPGGGGAAVISGKVIAPAYSPADHEKQPREVHDPLPSDKLASFEVARVDRLRGVWQSPGSILELSRGRARR